MISEEKKKTYGNTHKKKSRRGNFTMRNILGMTSLRCCKRLGYEKEGIEVYLKNLGINEVQIDQN